MQTIAQESLFTHQRVCNKPFGFLYDRKEQDACWQDYAHQWAADKIGSTLVADQNDPVRERIAKISVRKGSALIWNSFLLHANRLNCSENWRLVQYVRMYPLGKTPFGPLEPYIDAYSPKFKMTQLV